MLENTNTTEALKKALADTKKEKDRIHTIDTIMPEQKARHAWVEIKSS